ncbi:hypothetical protein [Arenimonas alkanexedens]
MNRSSIAFGVFLGCAVLAGTVSAASVANVEQQRRSDLSVAIIEKWGSHVEGAYSRSSEAWGQDMLPLLMKAPLESLQLAANARTFDAMNDALVAKAAPVPTMPRAGAPIGRVSGSSALPVAKSEDVTAGVGGANTDLVYVPVVPCRVIDTRLVGGKIGAVSTRSFEIASTTDYLAQGGSATDCSVGNVGDISAAVINFTTVSPDYAGFVTVYDFGGVQPLAATVNYVTNESSGNLTIVPLDDDAAGDDITAFTFAPTHLVGDIVGYFVQPQATAFQCVSTFVTENILANQPFDLQIPSCPVSYAITGAGCRTPGFNEASWAINGLFTSGGNVLGFCSGNNVTSGTITVEGTAQCCRVSGR